MSKMSKSVTHNAPAILNPLGADKWREMVAEGYKAGDALTAYCANYARWMGAEQWLSTPGNGTVVTIKDDKGNIKSHAPVPQLKVSADAAKEMARIMKALEKGNKPACAELPRGMSQNVFDAIIDMCQGNEDEAIEIAKSPTDQEIAKVLRVVKGQKAKWMIDRRKVI